MPVLDVAADEAALWLWSRCHYIDALESARPGARVGQAWVARRLLDYDFVLRRQAGAHEDGLEALRRRVDELTTASQGKVGRVR